MKNEEKADKIALNNCRYYGGEYDSYKECLDSAIEMAEWKTQQAIERVTEFLNGCGDYWYVSKDSEGDAVLDRYSLLKDIIQVLKED